MANLPGLIMSSLLFLFLFPMSFVMWSKGVHAKPINYMDEKVRYFGPAIAFFITSIVCMGYSIECWQRILTHN